MNGNHGNPHHYGKSRSNMEIPSLLDVEFPPPPGIKQTVTFVPTNKPLSVPGITSAKPPAVNNTSARFLDKVGNTYNQVSRSKSNGSPPDLYLPRMSSIGGSPTPLLAGQATNVPKIPKGSAQKKWLRGIRMCDYTDHSDQTGYGCELCCILVPDAHLIMKHLRSIEHLRQLLKCWQVSVRKKEEETQKNESGMESDGSSDSSFGDQRVKFR